MISQLLEKHQTTKQKHDMQKGAILIAASNIINQITESKKKESQCFRQYFNSNKYEFNDRVLGQKTECSADEIKKIIESSS